MDRPKTLNIKDIAELTAKAVNSVAFTRYKKEDIEEVKNVIRHLEGLDESYQKLAGATAATIKNMTQADVSPYLSFKLHELSRRLFKFASNAHVDEGMRIMKSFESTYLFFKQQHKMLSAIVQMYDHQIIERNKANGLEIPDNPVQDISAE
jgi:hypothetical protein